MACIIHDGNRYNLSSRKDRLILKHKVKDLQKHYDSNRHNIPMPFDKIHEAQNHKNKLKKIYNVKIEEQVKGKIITREAIPIVINKKVQDGKTIWHVRVQRPQFDRVLYGKSAIKEYERDVRLFKSIIFNEKVEGHDGNIDEPFERAIKTDDTRLNVEILRKSIALRLDNLNLGINEVRDRIAGYQRSIQDGTGTVNDDYARDLRDREQLLIKQKNDLIDYNNELLHKTEIHVLIEEALQDIGIHSSNKKTEDTKGMFVNFPFTEKSRIEMMMDELKKDIYEAKVNKDGSVKLTNEIKKYPKFSPILIRELEFIIAEWESILKLKDISPDAETVINPDLLNNLSKTKQLDSDLGFTTLEDIEIVKDITDVLTITEVIDETEKKYFNYELTKELFDALSKNLAAYKRELDDIKFQYVKNEIFKDKDRTEGAIKHAYEIRSIDADLRDKLLALNDGRHMSSSSFGIKQFIRLMGVLDNGKDHLSSLNGEFLDMTRSNLLGVFAHYLWVEARVVYDHRRKTTMDTIKQEVTKVKDYLHDVRPELIRKNKPDYDVFFEEDERGNYNGKLVHPYKTGYKELIREIKDEHFKRVAALKRSNSALSGYVNEFNKFYQELLKQSDIIDYRKLPEIQKFFESDKHIKDLFYDSYNDVEIEFTPDKEYKKELIKKLGSEYLYQKVVDQIFNNMRAYALERSREEQRIPDKSDENYDSAVQYFKNWDLRNNPIHILLNVVDNINNSEPTERLYKGKTFHEAVGTRNLYHDNFITLIPARMERKSDPSGVFNFYETEETLDYYSKKFPVVVEDDVLRDGYEFMTMLIEDLNRLMPEHIEEELFHINLPYNHKSWANDFNLKGVFSGTLFRNVAASSQREFVNTVTYKPEQGDIIDPLTNKKVGKAKVRGFMTDEGFKKYFFNALFIKKIAEYKKEFGEFADEKERERVEQEIRKIVDLELNELITKKKDFELDNILIRYAQVAYDYFNRENILPLIDYLLQFQDPTFLHDNGELDPKVIDKYNSKAQDWLAKRIKGIRTESDNILLRKKFEKSSLKKLYDKAVKKSTKYSAYTLWDKIGYSIHKYVLYGVYDREGRELIQMYLDGVMTSDDVETRTKALQGLQDTYALWAEGGITHLFFGFNVTWALGWNYKSAIKNLFEGALVANMQEALLGRNFTIDDYRRSLKIIMESSGNFYSFGRVKTKNAKILRHMMELYNTLQDNTADTNKYTLQSRALENVNRIRKFHFTASAEYINQGQVVVMMLMNEKIKGKDGTISNLWDQLDWDMKEDKIKLKNNFNTKNNKELIEGIDSKDPYERPSQQSVNLKVKIEEIITTIHGNYSNLRTIYGRKRPLAPFYLALKTYAPEKFNMMFGGKRFDLASGRTREGILKNVDPGYAAGLAIVNYALDQGFKLTDWRIKGKIKAMFGLTFGLASFTISQVASYYRYANQDALIEKHKALKPFNIAKFVFDMTLGVTSSIAMGTLYAMGNLFKVNTKYRYLHTGSSNKEAYRATRATGGMMGLRIMMLFGQYLIMKNLFKLLLSGIDDDDKKEFYESVYNVITNHMMNIFEESDPFKFMLLMNTFTSPNTGGIAYFNILRNILEALEKSIYKLGSGGREMITGNHPPVSWQKHDNINFWSVNEDGEPAIMSQFIAPLLPPPLRKPLMDPSMSNLLFQSYASDYRIKGSEFELYPKEQKEEAGSEDIGPGNLTTEDIKD